MRNAKSLLPRHPSGTCTLLSCFPKSPLAPSNPFCLPKPLLSPPPPLAALVLPAGGVEESSVVQSPRLQHESCQRNRSLRDQTVQN